MWQQDRMPQDWGLQSDKKLEDEELGTIIRDCIKQLPDKWSAVFSLRVIEEYSTNEVCKELGITPSNLWVILHRARTQLRDCVEKKWIV
jgi:RNA polymerase sigma-70 factor (ECF subfamily)